MEKKISKPLIPLETRQWFISPDHVFGGVFNLLWCLLYQHKAAGYTYLAFVFLSLIKKVPYLKAFFLAYALGMLADMFFS